MAIAYQYAGVFISLTALSVVSVIVTTAVGARVVARLPSDYFVNTERRANKEYLHLFHPAFRGAIPILKNVIGATLVIAGIIMLVIPGQGLLTLLAGIVLSDFPGKHRCELWLLRQRQVSKSINWLRRRAGEPPLDLE